MIDFKITFQNDEISYGDYEKESLISFSEMKSCS